MKKHMYAGVSLLLGLWAGNALSAPLTFGWLDGWTTRRDKFEKHFVIGDAIQRFEVGKKQLALPAGQWVVSEVATYVPEVTEVGSDNSIGSTVDGSLSLQDTASGDQAYLQTLLSTPSNRIWLSSLSRACGGGTHAKVQETIYLQQLDSTRTDRQSCVQISGRVVKDKASGTPLLLVLTRLMESRDGDYLEYNQSRTVLLAEGQGIELADLDKPLRAYIDGQLRWGSQLKADIARQMGW